MKKYMVIYTDDDGNAHAVFYDSVIDADNARMDLDVNLGYYAEVYERTDHGDGGEFYEFAWA